MKEPENGSTEIKLLKDIDDEVTAIHREHFNTNVKLMVIEQQIEQMKVILKEILAALQGSPVVKPAVALKFELGKPQ
jgi:hypothetical protein